MKLRNKKTGEIAEPFGLTCKNGRTFIQFEDEKGTFKFEAHSLTKLNEEWEDYEEPKELGYWHYDTLANRPDFVENCNIANEDKKLDKQIGNYFETKEEAEKAVEKLKTWKRLKDKKFKFRKWRTADIGGDKYYFVITAEVDDADKGDLNLLFGGEE